MSNSTPQAQVTLSYFDFPGGRGEACRLALHLAGVEFHDDRVAGKDWPGKKADTPYGGMPVLHIRDKGELAQSNAILGFIGAGHDLLPEDNFEGARHLAILNAVEECSTRLFAGTSADDATRKKAREEFAAGFLRDWSESICDQIRGPFVGGDKISVADLKLYVNVKMLQSGMVDHIAADYFDAYPRMMALHRAVASHPGVAAFESAQAGQGA